MRSSSFGCVFCPTSTSTTCLASSSATNSRDIEMQVQKLMPWQTPSPTRPSLNTYAIRIISYWE
jgi:hypothetical protein